MDKNTGIRRVIGWGFPDANNLDDPDPAIVKRLVGSGQILTGRPMSGQTGAKKFDQDSESSPISARSQLQKPTFVQQQQQETTTTQLVSHTPGLVLDHLFFCLKFVWKLIILKKA